VVSGDSVLVSVVRERSRVLAPAALFAHTLILAALGPLGIAPPVPVYAFDVVMLACAGALSFFIVTRRVPARWVHVAAVALVGTATLSILASMYATNRQVYGLLLMLQIASLSTVFDTRASVSAILVVIGLGIPLEIRAGGPDTAVYIAATIAAGFGGTMVHVMSRRALLRAEHHRAEASDAAAKLTEQLAELKKLQDQLLHSQRMESIGTLAAGIAHDMNNVLASIRNLGQLLIAEGAEGRADVQQIITQTERGAALTRGLLAFSRRGQYRKVVLRLGDVMRSGVPLLERTLPKTIAVRTELAVDDLCVEADATQLEQVLVNLALNAKDAMRDAGTLTIRAERVGGVASIVVSDTGCGMDAATRSRVFEPFFTTKTIGQGTGLGLSTVWGIVQSHGGTIEVESEPGHGATFTITLPLTTKQPTQPIVRMPVEQAPVRGTVLVADDEEPVRSTTRRLLERMGLQVVTAENGEDALARFAEHAKDIRLVVLDVGMPVMDGAECFRRLREQSEVPVLIATGYSDESQAHTLVSAGACILEKPFSSAQLKQEVLRLLTGESAAA
jgi:signal transduction histidine kinase/CheY-like chemotaxis protein